MRSKKWVFLSFALGLVVILDVTPVQSQFGDKGGKGSKGDRKAERTFTFGQPPGGAGAGFNGGGAGFNGGGFNGGGAGLNGGGAGFGGQPGAGFNGGAGFGGGGKGGDRGMGGPPSGFGQPGGDRGFGGKGGDRGMGGPPSGFGQPGGDRGMGGPPSGFGGGDRGTGGPPGGGNRGPQIDPETSWNMLVKVSGGTNTIKFDNIPPDSRIMLRRFAEKAGTPPLPETGEWGKEQFMAHATASAQLMQLNQGGSLNGQNNNWGQGGGDGDPRAMMRGKDREKKEQEEERPVAIRYGKLPKDVPAMFTEMDSDKDGQIGLYEWRNSSSGGSILAFQEMDLNGDGLLTVEEYTRYTTMKTDRERATAYENGETPAPKPGANGRGGPGGGRMPGGGMTGFGSGGTPDKTSEKSKDERKDEKRSGKDGGGAPGGRGMWGAGDASGPRKK